MQIFVFMALFGHIMLNITSLDHWNPQNNFSNWVAKSTSRFTIKLSLRHICISLFFSEFLCIFLHFSAFFCISLHFSSFLYIYLHFSCNSLHFFVFLCISLDSIAVSLFTITTITTVIYYYSLSFIIIHYYHYYSLSKLFGVYCRPMDAIFMILCIGCWWQRLMADCSGVGASEPTFLPLSRRPTPSCPCS